MLFVIIGHDGPERSRAQAHGSPAPSGIRGPRRRERQDVIGGPFTDGSGEPDHR